MGRPKKEKELDHNNIISIRLSDMELEYLDQASKSMNIFRSEYLRNLILEKPMIYKYEIIADPSTLQKLTGEIGKIGSNLNQIAKSSPTSEFIIYFRNHEIKRFSGNLMKKKM